MPGFIGSLDNCGAKKSFISVFVSTGVVHKPYFLVHVFNESGAGLPRLS